MSGIDKKIRICVVITDSINLYSLYRGQFQFLEDNGFSVTAIASGGKEHDILSGQGINTKRIYMKKTPSPIIDCYSLIKLIIHFLFNRYDIVSVSTPKAALLGALAAYFTFHKNIIYTVRGRAYENKTGIERQFYDNIEKLICTISKKVFSISKEIKADLVKNGICNKNKIFTLGEGSSNGVDLTKFKLSPLVIEEVDALREEMNISTRETIIVYSGRIRKDKGINELVRAFSSISKNNTNVSLILQGRFEEIDPLCNDVLNEITINPKIFTFPWGQNVVKYFAIADIFAFPSHREGFGNVALEAGALSVPVIAFNVVGCRESIIDGETGILVGKIDWREYEKALRYLIGNRLLRIKLGGQGRERVNREFSSLIIWNRLINEYQKML